MMNPMPKAQEPHSRIPRLQAQQDAVNIVCHSKTRSNPENNVGLITLAKYMGQRRKGLGRWVGVFPYLTHCGIQVAILL